MRIFISGPIENTSIIRLRRFDEIKRFFENKGYEVITEIDIPYPQLEDEIESLVGKSQKDPDSATWLVLATKKLWLMAQCDALFLLPKWDESDASSIMRIAAKKLGMPIYVDDGSAIILADENDLKNWFQRQMGAVETA